MSTINKIWGLVFLLISLCFSAQAFADGDLCAQQGAKCVPQQPNPWGSYSYCSEPAEDFPQSNFIAYCQANGGHMVAPYCYDTTPVTDANMLGRIQYFASHVTGPITNTFDAGWGVAWTTGYWCHGSPAFTDGILTGDTRPITITSQFSPSSTQTQTYLGRRGRTLFCPPGSKLQMISGKNQCYTPPVGCSSFATAHPCSITTGNKFKPQTDWTAPIGPLKFSRMYNSLNSSTASITPIGVAWTHNYNASIKLLDSQSQALLLRPDGRLVTATNIYTDTTIAGTGGWFVSRDLSLKLSQLPDGSWKLLNIKSNTTESYDVFGRLTKISYANNQYVNLTYPAHSDDPATMLVSQVTDNFGQTLTMTYNTAGQLLTLTLPTTKVISYTYDAQNRLVSVLRPGFGTTPKTYVYSESSTVAPSGNPNLLTGIIDENNKRFESYAYDSADRGISTTMAGGVEQYSLVHGSTSATVTDPHGLTKQYTLISIAGTPYVSNIVSGGTQDTSYAYDDAGNITSMTKFGVTTNYAYDLSRNLETSRTEAVGTAQQRTITTQYDPILPVPTLITEAGRTTAYTYDVTGNVLTKIVTDTATNTKRTWTYTYNSVGQKLTEKNPAGETTTYTYASNGTLLTVTNAIGLVTTYSTYNTLGQPTDIMLPSGGEVLYTYDDAGRVVQTQDVVVHDIYQTTDDTSNNRIKWPQWVIDLVNAWCALFGLASPFDSAGGLSANVPVPFYNSGSASSEFTNYVYDAIGQLTSVTLPTGETLAYSYDDAHRLIGATDSLGNTITYTLNGAGDITNTSIKDPNGNIKLKTQQVFDTLGRVQQDVGNNGQSTTYSYDGFDNLTGTSDALSRQSSSTYDALNRKATDVDALNQTTRYGYNALDQLLTVTDARNNVTTYVPNAFGENTSQTSPDTGLTSYSYTNGRLMSSVDSNSIGHSYSYDGLGRVTQRVDGTGSSALTTTFGYDAGVPGSTRNYNKGSLTSVKNANSEVRYNRDTAGHVIEKVTAISPIVPIRVEYQYVAKDMRYAMMMPSGHRITYGYTAGRMTAIGVDANTLISNIQYGPTGPVSWTWGASGSTDTNTLTYDLDGRLTNVSSTGVLGRSYTYDAGNRIQTIADTLAGIGTQTYSHDSLDRLTQQVLSGQTLGYGYDANSNRTSKTVTTGGTAVSSSYAIQSSTNRINTTTVGTGTALTSTYLPTGQLVTDGIRTYTYDATGRSTSIRNGSNLVVNTYNGLGERIKKSVGNVAIYFAYDEQGHLIGEYDQNRNMIREYIWFGDRLVGMYSNDALDPAWHTPILLEVHTDHLGIPRAVTKGQGASRVVLWRYDGDAFGDVQPTVPAGTTFTMPVRMPGQYYDAEVGTSYNYFRDYDASTGRYVQSDPIGFKGGNNTYGYVGASPLMWIDPLGEEAGSFWCKSLFNCTPPPANPTPTPGNASKKTPAEVREICPAKNSNNIDACYACCTTGCGLNGQCVVDCKADCGFTCTK